MSESDLPRSLTRQLAHWALLGPLLAGCAGVPPMEDAKLVEVALASPGDLSRLEVAKDAYYRATTRFQLPELTILRPDWPVVRVVFRSQRELFSPQQAGAHRVVIYLCGEKDREWRTDGWDAEVVLWRGRAVDQETARRIARQLAVDPTPQEYEVFFDYDNWDRSEERDKADPITLLPLQDDVCLSVKKLNFPLAPDIGTPLLIDRKAVNAAVGELPRPLAVPLPPAGS